jgi:hypothetical protein
MGEVPEAIRTTLNVWFGGIATQPTIDGAAQALTAALRLDDPERRAVDLIEALSNAWNWVEFSEDWRNLSADEQVATAQIWLRAVGPVPPPASDPETVERGMVERAARVIDPYAFTGYRYGPEAAAQSREAALNKADAILTAALQIDTAVERTARGLYERFICLNGGEPISEHAWPPSNADQWRAEAQAAINALLNTTDAKEAGERG